MRANYCSLKTYAISAALLHTGVASAQAVFCTPGIGGGRIDGDLDIATPCELTRTDVRGNVRLFAGGSLIARDVRIRGNLEGNRANFVDMGLSRIDGNLLLEEMVGDRTRVERTEIRGNVLLSANRSRIEMLDNEIEQSMEVFANTGGVLLIGNRIDDELECEDNAPAPFGRSNRAGDVEDQCENLQPETSQPAPEPPPPAPPPAPAPSPSPAPSPEPPAPPPSVPTAPPSQPTTDFVPEPEGGGGGAIGLWWALLVPLVVRLRLTRRSRR